MYIINKLASLRKKVRGKEQSEMSFLDHVEALRGHLTRSIAVVLILTIIAFFFKDFLFSTILFGPLSPDFCAYHWMCDLSHWIGAGDSLCMTPNCKPDQLIMTTMGEPFIIHIQVSFMAGIIVGFPYLFYEFWSFISPGLYEKERKAARGIIFVCTLLFLTGVLFGYFVIAPMAINFLLDYSIPMAVSHPTVASYLEYMTMFTFPTGIVFEMPVFIFFLAKIGLITHHFMRRYRRQAIILILFVAAIITPSPDFVSQLLVGIPLYILYELSIYVAKREIMRQEREEAAASAAARRGQ